MSRSPEDKRRTRIALIVCSSVLLFRSCNGNLAKEEKSGVVVEPPKIEEITFDDVFVPSSTEPTIDPNLVPEVHYYYPETTTTTTENVDEFEETTTTTRAK